MKRTLLLVMALAAGCSFNPGKGNNDLGGGGDDMLGGGDDMLGDGPDMTMVCTPGAKTCASGMLSTCNLDGTGIDTTTCVLGCNTAGNDCQALQPTAPAIASDFAYGGLSELTIAASQTLLVFDTANGEIRDGAGTVVRMPNATPMSRNVESGIGFHVASGVGIWTFSKLTVPATTTIVFKSANAASILSATDLTIAGTIDVRGYADPTKALMPGAASTLCSGTVAGPGGTIGGTQSTVATGAGHGGFPADLSTGGGGAGYGDPGGDGGKNGATAGGSAGTMAGTPAINPLGGGFGGGASFASGGGGGGALQLAAEGTITVSGKINAGGCGGSPGLAAAQGGGGGGSGGAVLVESPTVHVTSTGTLAANGGGGGAGGSANATAGDPGDASTASANGGSGSGAHNGGSGDSLGSTSGTAGSNGNGAGGGGGGVGRLRFNARTTATVDSGATISPAQTAGTVVIQ